MISLKSLWVEKQGYVCACVCVCVCERERERERLQMKEEMKLKEFNQSSVFKIIIQITFAIALRNKQEK